MVGARPHGPRARRRGRGGGRDRAGRGSAVPGDDERAVYAVARQLSRQAGWPGAYDAAQRFLGDAGMVELVSLCGYYTLISFLLNAFAVPLPPGARPQWDE